MMMQKLTAALASAALTLSLVTPAVPAQAANADTGNYAKLLQYSLYFYDANMCGTEVDEKGLLNWRGDCHTADAVPGGFHDAGDHVKFGLPAGYTASTLGWSYYEFSDAYDTTGQTAHLRTITDHFAQFFKDSTTLSGNTVTKLVYQVGDGDADHAEWCAPEQQSAASRKTYSTTNGASDIAAEYAAALAVNYLNFGNAEDLKYAEALYAFSTKYNRVATDGCQAFYPSSGCNDDQAWAAGWLALATGNAAYKSACASKCGSIGWAHSWDNVMLGAQCVNAHLTKNWNTVNGYLSGKCSGSNYLFMDAWGSARYNASMQLCALAATQNSSADYTAWCKGQMAYLLGQNPASTCFVVGLGDNAAKYPHHRAASGYNSYGALGKNTTYSSNGHTLTGALVGGPTTASGAYVDSVQDYQANEVALDYNAGLVGAAAGLYAITGSGTTDAISAIPGIKSGVTEPTLPATEATTEAETQAATSAQNDPTEPAVTETTSQTYTITPAQTFVNGDEENFPGWKWSSFGIPSDEEVTRVEVKISAKNGNLNKWVGAFGTNVDDAANEYWYQTDSMEETYSTKSAVIGWDIPADIAPIQYETGNIQFGIWYVEPSVITIDAITVYTEKTTVIEPATEPTEAPTEATTETTTEAPTEATTEATEAPTEATTEATEVPTAEADIEEETYAANPFVKGDVNDDGEFDLLDIVTVQRWMHGRKITLNNWHAADLAEDSCLDIFDLNLLKKLLLSK